ncbi:hypothetical protein FACS1894189_3490 [Planctomycetales bacterium]|nr:hypothetical protein FACS1894189_3490 [Planctomycetales bacterium]
MSNKNKYKVPWTVCQQKNGMYRVISTERTIANYLYECEADIIAAAPEMLEWLEWVNVAIKPLVDNCCSELRNCEVCQFEPCNFRKIEMLIAKAKGENATTPILTNSTNYPATGQEQF